MEQRYQLLAPLSPEERAAIQEVDGGLVRDDAQYEAFALVDGKARGLAGEEAGREGSSGIINCVSGHATPEEKRS